MNHRYTANIYTQINVEPIQISVRAFNEAEAIQKIKTLPYFRKFDTFPMRDMN